MKDDENDTIKKLLRKVKEAEKNDYPMREARREMFTRWLFSRRFGCFIFWIVILGTILIWLLNNL